MSGRPVAGWSSEALVQESVMTAMSVLLMHLVMAAYTRFSWGRVWDVITTWVEWVSFQCQAAMSMRVWGGEHTPEGLMESHGLLVIRAFLDHALERFPEGCVGVVVLLVRAWLAGHFWYLLLWWVAVAGVFTW